MEMQTEMHRMGLNPFLTFYIEAMLNVDANANAKVKCEHTLNERVFLTVTSGRNHPSSTDASFIRRKHHKSNFKTE